MLKTVFSGTCISVHGELNVSFKSKIGFWSGYKDEVDISKKVPPCRQSFTVLIIHELLLMHSWAVMSQQVPLNPGRESTPNLVFWSGEHVLPLSRAEPSRQ